MNAVCCFQRLTDHEMSPEEATSACSLIKRHSLAADLILSRWVFENEHRDIVKNDEPHVRIFCQRLHRKVGFIRQHYRDINKERKIWAGLCPWTLLNLFLKHKINSWKDFKGELCTVALCAGGSCCKNAWGIRLHPSGGLQSGQRHQYIHYAARMETVPRPRIVRAWYWCAQSAKSHTPSFDQKQHKAGRTKRGNSLREHTSDNRIPPSKHGPLRRWKSASVSRSALQLRKNWALFRFYTDQSHPPPLVPAIHIQRASIRLSIWADTPFAMKRLFKPRQLYHKRENMFNRASHIEMFCKHMQKLEKGRHQRNHFNCH